MSDTIDWKARCELLDGELVQVNKCLKFQMDERAREKAEMERVNKALNPILLLLGETMDHVPSELRSRIVSAVAETKAKGLL